MQFESKGQDLVVTALREGSEQTMTVTPQSEKQFELVDITLHKQPAPTAGIPWTFNYPGAEKGYIKHLIKIPAMGTQPMEFMAGAPPADVSTFIAPVPPPVKDVRKSLEALTRAVERLEKKLDQLQQPAQPPATEKQETRKPEEKTPAKPDQK